MFSWLRRVLRNEPSVSEQKRYESEQRKKIQKFLKENPDSSEAIKLLVKDFEERSLKENEGGSSSSPISSP